MSKCMACGNEYNYQNKIVYDKDGNLTGCYHDHEFIAKAAEGLVIQGMRAKHAKSLIQPYNRDGSINKDFKKLYPHSEVFK